MNSSAGRLAQRRAWIRHQGVSWLWRPGDLKPCWKFLGRFQDLSFLELSRELYALPLFAEKSSKIWSVQALKLLHAFAAEISNDFRWFSRHFWPRHVWQEGLVWPVTENSILLNSAEISNLRTSYRPSKRGWFKLNSWKGLFWEWISVLFSFRGFWLPNADAFSMRFTIYYGRMIFQWQLSDLTIADSWTRSFAGFKTGAAACFERQNTIERCLENRPLSNVSNCTVCTTWQSDTCCITGAMREADMSKVERP